MGHPSACPPGARIRRTQSGSLMNHRPFAARLAHFARVAALLWWFAGLSTALGGAPALAAQVPRNVLVLNSDNIVLPGLAVFNEALVIALRAEYGPEVELFNEFLGLDEPRPADYGNDLLAFLRKKYAAKRIDAIVAVRAPALKFLLEHRDEFLPGVAVVHVWIDTQELAGQELPPDMIGVPVELRPEKTIELALRLHPRARRVVVITGTSAYDRGWEALVRRAFRPLEARVEFEYWAGLALPEILDRVKRMPADSIVYLPGLRQDGTGQRMVPQEVATEIVSISPAPVYGNASNFREVGTMGGYVASIEEIARQAAHLLSRLLRGERPEALAPPAVVPNAYILNMRQLRRFGFDESAIPPGAILRYRQPTLWEAYRWQIILVVVLLLTQAALIAALLVQLRVRRQTQSELHESEERMSLVAAATNLGMWVQDVSGRKFWTNAQQRELLGIGTSEPYDLERCLNAVHEDDGGPVRQAIERALESGGEFDVRYRVPLANGTVRWLASRGRVEVDARGRTVCIRGVTADVTAMNEAELSAQQHRNELAHLSRVAMLGQLSGSLAHELNQPLTAILSNAQAALRFLKADAADLDEIREILVDIVAADRRAGDVILRLRALFERGEANQEPLDLNELIREILRLLHSDFVSRNVSIARELEAGLPTVLGDRVQLQQLLLNLAINACEAMADTPAGGRRLVLRTELNDRHEVVVSVTDRGKGIASDQLERIFEPFVSSKDLGIGLGLAIGRSIVAAHGGRLWASSNADRGATFSFTLPVHGTASSSRAPERDSGERLAALTEGT